MRFRLLRLLDAVAHFLYCPAMPGRRSARARWYHRIHLIPGFVLRWICDRYELALGVTRAELLAERARLVLDGVPSDDLLRPL